MLHIIKAYAVKNLCYIAAQKMVPKGIVVHSTGANNPNLKRYVDAADELGVNAYGNHWNTAKPGGQKVCVHAFIGYDKDKQVRVAEILPLNICCWGVGQGKKGSYNYNPPYIQFEICEDGLTDEGYYNAVFSTAAEYCALLCKTYGLSTDNIVGHCEAYRQGYGSNHSDPEHWMKKFGETMADFRKTVCEILRNDSSTEKKEEADLSQSEFHKDDLVSLAQDALYYNGKTIPAWVKAQNWYIKEEPKGQRVVIDKNETGTHAICSPIHEKYLKLVKAANSVANEEESPSKCPYLVKVTTDSLTIRKDANSDSEKVGSITDNGVYTIVEERQGAGASKWGKLKSGVGWISLDFVKEL